MRSHVKQTDRFPDETDIQWVVGEYQDLKQTAVVAAFIHDRLEQQMLDF